MTSPLFKWGFANKRAIEPSQHDIQTVRAPAVKLVALNTAGTAFDPPKWIIADQKGTCTIVDAAGNTLTSFPLTGLEQNIACTAISNLSTTTKVWGGY